MPLRISVITAIYNRAATLGQALESVHGQSWPSVEHIVIDGGSTDGSLALLHQHRGGIARLVSEPDQGLYDALNKGIRHATGDIVGFMHADDQFASPEALASIASAFEDPSVGAVYGDLVYVNKADGTQVVRYWRAGQYVREQFRDGWMPPHPTFYVRRELYSRFGTFDTRYRISADYDNMLRILWSGGVKAAYVPQVLVRMRTGGMSNRSLLNMLHKSREDYSAVRRNGMGGVRTVILKNIKKLPQFIIKAGAVADLDSPKTPALK